MTDPNRVLIFDTTLRDGEQSPGCSMTQPEKLRLAKALADLGVDVIEAGFPIASRGDWESVNLVAREVRGPIIAGLARCTREDIDTAWCALKDAARPRIHVFLATSAIHRQYKLNMAKEQIIQTAVEGVAFARSLCADVEFSPEDARALRSSSRAGGGSRDRSRRHNDQRPRYRRLYGAGRILRSLFVPQTPRAIQLQARFSF